MWKKSPALANRSLAKAGLPGLFPNSLCIKDIFSIWSGIWTPDEMQRSFSMSSANGSVYPWKASTVTCTTLSDLKISVGLRIPVLSACLSAPYHICNWQCHAYHLWTRSSASSANQSLVNVVVSLYPKQACCSPTWCLIPGLGMFHGCLFHFFIFLTAASRDDIPCR